MTLHTAAQGAGKAALIHDASTDNEHITALDRAPKDSPSPEQPFAAFAFGPAAQGVLAEFIPDLFREEIDGFAGLPPQFLFDQLQFLTDVPNGDTLARAILTDLGLLPETATLQEADDLIAVSYQHETPAQLGMRRLRALGALIAAGEELWTVLWCLPRNGPTSDFYAINVAVRAGQAADATAPRVTAMPKPWIV
ncbi:MAG: hypothetical protein HGA45_27600 [Chloroflexales bacterium]|nr:hypothetical protein [Chloroflexales bacterium]